MIRATDYCEVPGDLAFFMLLRYLEGYEYYSKQRIEVGSRKVVNEVINGKKICSKCNKNLDTSNFYIQNKRTNRLFSVCKQCCHKNRINKKGLKNETT